MNEAALSALSEAIAREADARRVPASVVAAELVGRARSRRRRALIALPIGVACAAALWSSVAIGHHMDPATGTCASQLTPAYDGDTGLITFCPDTPAVADEVNHNFNQLLLWLQQKVGAVGNANIATSGSLNVSGTTTLDDVAAWTINVDSTAYLDDVSISGTVSGLSATVSVAAGSPGCVTEDLGLHAGGYQYTCPAGKVLVGGNWQGNLDNGKALQFAVCCPITVTVQ